MVPCYFDPRGFPLEGLSAPDSSERLHPYRASFFNARSLSIAREIILAVLLRAVGNEDGVVGWTGDGDCVVEDREADAYVCADGWDVVCGGVWQVDC